MYQCNITPEDHGIVASATVTLHRARQTEHVLDPRPSPCEAGMPPREARLLVPRALELAGFEVGRLDGRSMLIRGPINAFERLFCCQIAVDELGSVGTVVCGNVTSLLLPLETIPRAIRRWIESVAFVSTGAMIWDPNHAPQPVASTPSL